MDKNMKPIRLHILIHAEKGFDTLICTKTIETLRVGFPTLPEANIRRFVTARSVSSGVFGERFAPLTYSRGLLCTQTGVERAHLLEDLIGNGPDGTEHNRFIEHVINTADDNYTNIILDGDLIFFDSIEETIRFQLEDYSPHRLIHGQWIPAHTRAGMIWKARIHTHFFILPEVRSLRTLLASNPLVTPWTPFYPVRPQVIYTYDGPVFYDTCAQLFQFLSLQKPDLTATFCDEFQRRYAHITCGSSLSVLLSKQHLDSSKLVERHHLAVHDPEKLRDTNRQYLDYMFQEKEQA